MKPKVLLVAHDAGGAEILAAWYKKNHDRYQVYLALDGPALRIFRRENNVVETVGLSIIERFGQGDFVLTASSLEADLERRALALARQLQVHSITFLDHWDLYRERFGDAGNWFAGLPDEVWVGDRYAYNYAVTQGFPEERVRLVANPYFEAIRAEAANVIGAQVDGVRILYICEPISRKLKATFGAMAFRYHDERKIMADFLEVLAAHRGEFTEVTLRLHPSEQKVKYEDCVERYRTVYPISFSTQERLLDDLLSHAIIVGVESNALALAEQLGKTVYSCITGAQWHISLPHQEIIRINDFHQIFHNMSGERL